MMPKKSNLTQGEYEVMVREVNRLRNQIHLFNNEEISEAALDDFKHKITVYETENPDQISPNSPNMVVAGGVLEGFTKYTHERRMLSINDVFSVEELGDWERRWQDFLYGKKDELPEIIARHSMESRELIGDTRVTAQKDRFAESVSVSYVCEPKIDGLSMSIHYQQGLLVRAVTRGDGWIGEDITQNVRQIESIPKQVSDLRNIEVRGEVFLTKKNFMLLNQRIIAKEIIGKMGKTGPEATFANPRNAAAGTVRNLDSSIVGERNLSFIAYGCFVENII